VEQTPIKVEKDLPFVVVKEPLFLKVNISVAGCLVNLVFSVLLLSSRRGGKGCCEEKARAGNTCPALNSYFMRKSAAYSRRTSTRR
jgi:hypothetical protein